jgi:heme oxygenase
MLQSLREQTRDQHRALESQPLLQLLVSSHIDHQHYGRLIRALWAFHQPLEEYLQLSAGSLLSLYPGGYHYQPRTPLLAQDIQRLGLSLPETDATAGWLPASSGHAYALGILYVIEGASLGGKLIAPHLAKQLQLSGQTGAAFYNLHETYDSWLPFRHWFASCKPEYNDQAGALEVIQGANAMFSGLHAHLNQW